MPKLGSVFPNPSPRTCTRWNNGDDELYEALKRDLNEEAARRIAEVVPAAADLATKLDVHDVNLAVARLEAKMEALHASTLRWMIAMFVPAWAGTWATVAAVILKS